MVREFHDKHALWMSEDNCDALGPTYDPDGRCLFTRTIGNIGTASFYLLHYMTMGEGRGIRMFFYCTKVSGLYETRWGR